MATTNKFEENFNKDQFNASKDKASSERKDDTLGKEKEMKDALSESKDNVKAFVGGKAKQAMEGAGVENWDDVKDRAGQMVQKARTVASDVGGRLQETAGQTLEQVSATVKKYPFPAILIGFGVGALCGLLLSQRRSA